MLLSSVSPGTRAMGLSDTLNGDLDDEGDTLDSSGDEVFGQMLSYTPIEVCAYVKLRTADTYRDGLKYGSQVL